MSGAVTAVVAVAATAYSIYSSETAANEQEKALKKQAKLEKAAAKTEADNIREKGRRIAATQEASLSAAGVRLDDTGTSQALLTETTNLAEKDALAVLTTGANRAGLLQFQADAAASRGTSQAISSGLNFLSSSIGNYSKYQQSLRDTAMAQRTTKFSLLGADDTLKIDSNFQ